MLISVALSFLIGFTAASRLQPRDLSGPSVDFKKKLGTSRHLASGILYGLPDDIHQIPFDLLEGFGFNYNRGAGAQVGHGWVWGKDQYNGRINSAHQNYLLTRAHNGGFVMLLNDLWGFDSTQNISSPAPGDDGDWRDYDRFIDQVIADIKRFKMQQNLTIDIWNEPDLGGAFWGRSFHQYLQMWGRGWHKFNTAFGNTVGTSGPCTAYPPDISYDWWTQWAQFAVENKSIPSQYSWHMEMGQSSSLTNSYHGFEQIRQKYRLPSRQININEYAIFDEQNPSGAAFWISQLERYNAIGLRGNWLGGSQLHDLAASLLGKKDPNVYKSGGYFPNSEWWVYNYYSHNMTGARIATTVSSDIQLDAYATVGDDNIVRILFGTHPPTTGNYTVTLKHLSALGLPKSGTITVRTRGFYAANDVHFGKQGPPLDQGVAYHPYTGDTLTLGWEQSDGKTAYAWEFAI